MARVFKDIFLRKSGIMKETFGKFKNFMKNEGSTVDTEAANVYENYDMRLDKALHFAEDKMVKRIEEMYTNLKREVETTTKDMFRNFMDQMKNVYDNKISNIFVKSIPPPEPDSWPTSRPVTAKKPLSSYEIRDEENMRQLGMLDKEFANKTQIEEALKDIYTPASHELDKSI